MPLGNQKIFLKHLLIFWIKKITLEFKNFKNNSYFGLPMPLGNQKIFLKDLLIFWIKKITLEFKNFKNNYFKNNEQIFWFTHAPSNKKIFLKKLLIL